MTGAPCPPRNTRGTDRGTGRAADRGTRGVTLSSDIDRGTSSSHPVFRHRQGDSPGFPVYAAKPTEQRVPRHPQVTGSPGTRTLHSFPSPLEQGENERKKRKSPPVTRPRHRAPSPSGPPVNSPAGSPSPRGDPRPGATARPVTDAPQPAVGPPQRHPLPGHHGCTALTAACTRGRGGDPWPRPRARWSPSSGWLPRARAAAGGRPDPSAPQGRRAKARLPGSGAADTQLTRPPSEGRGRHQPLS